MGRTADATLPFDEGARHSKGRNLLVRNIADQKKRVARLSIRGKDGHPPVLLPITRNMQPQADIETLEVLDTILVPAHFSRYTEPPVDESGCGKRADDILRDGWLYIYVNGVLWREISVSNRHGACFYSDVNLDSYTDQQDRDQRIASGSPDQRVLLPYKINGHEMTVEVAYAPVQWTWERIEKFGGVAPEGSRRADWFPDDGKINQKGKQERQERMLALPLKEGFAIDFDDVVGDMGPVDNSLSYSYKLDQHTKTPYFVLEDPIGIAVELQKNFLEWRDKYVRWVQRITHTFVTGKIASGIIESKSSYRKHLSDPDFMQSWIKDTEKKIEEYKKKYEEPASRLVKWLEKTGAGSVSLAFEDFELEKWHEKENFRAGLAENTWATVTEGLGETENAKEFIETELNRTNSITNTVLDIAGKATGATDNLVTLVTGLIANQKEYWEPVKRIIERRYMIKITPATMSLDDLMDVLRGRSIKLLASAEVIPFERTTYDARKVTPMVDTIKINGRSIRHWSTIVADQPHLGRIILILQTVAIVQAVPKAFKEGGIEIVNAIGAISSLAQSLLAIATQRAEKRAASLATRNLLRRLTVRAGVIGAFADIISGAVNASSEAERGDGDAAMSWSAVGFGGMLGLVAIALGSNPVGWAIAAIGAVIALIGAISLIWTDNNPVENWLLYCYWGKMSYSCKGEMALGDRKYFPEYWKDKPEEEMEVIQRIMYQCEVKYTWNYNTSPTAEWIEVELAPVAYDEKLSRFLIEIDATYYDVDSNFRSTLRKKRLVGKNGKMPATTVTEVDGAKVMKFRINLIKDFNIQLTRAQQIKMKISYDPFGSGALMIPGDLGKEIDFPRYGTKDLVLY